MQIGCQILTVTKNQPGTTAPEFTLRPIMIEDMDTQWEQAKQKQPLLTILEEIKNIRENKRNSQKWKEIPREENALNFFV